MIDYFALALSHALLVLGIWLILQRDDLDNETPGKTGDGGEAKAEAAAPGAPGAPDPQARFRITGVKPRA